MSYLPDTILLPTNIASLPYCPAYCGLNARLNYCELSQKPEDSPNPNANAAPIKIAVGFESAQVQGRRGHSTRRDIPYYTVDESGLMPAHAALAQERFCAFLTKARIPFNNVNGKARVTGSDMTVLLQVITNGR